METTSQETEPPDTQCDEAVLLDEGDIGVCGIAVLDHFSCGISVILISNCGIAVFSEPAGCGFLAFWTVLKIILKVLQRFPSLFQFLIVSETGNTPMDVTYFVYFV